MEPTIVPQPTGVGIKTPDYDFDLQIVKELPKKMKKNHHEISLEEIADALHAVRVDQIQGMKNQSNDTSLFALFAPIDSVMHGAYTIQDVTINALYKAIVAKHYGNHVIGNFVIK